MFNKTRIAPTPSGYLHLGNVLSMLITTAIARKHNASILLRIDDLDHLRTKNKYVEDIFTTLRFLEIPWDEGPISSKDFQKNWSQRKRLPLYKDTLNILLKNDDLFACDCSRKKVSRSSKDLSYPGICLHKNLTFQEADQNWRIKIPMGEVAEIKQISGKPISSRLPPPLQYFIVKKKDGLPAYQLTSVIDDIHFGVDTIIRGKDLNSSSVAQLLLAKKLGSDQFRDIQFLHHPLVMASQHQKLAKSAGSTSIYYMRQHGASKESIYQEISGLLKLPHSVSNFEEFVKVFDVKNLPKDNLVIG
ncbi:MAG TPA: glutamate--tRNA ligase family protein [Anditalea sp.]|nr:glutamate--tRNA ligase family protein [Anditalea sp.]